METKTKERLALGALFFQSGLCFSSWASRIPDIKENFEFTDSELGALLLIRPMGSLVGLPIAGFVVDRYGSKISSSAGIMIFSLSLLMIGLSNQVVFLAMSILLFGLSANLINISNNAHALLVQNNYGKVIMASFHGLWSLAGFFGAALGAFTLSFDIDVVNHFLIINGIVITLLVLSFPHLTAKSSDQKQGKFVLKKPDRHLMKLGIIAFLGLMCEGCMFDWSGVYFKQIIKAEEGLIAVGYMSFMGTMALGRFISDRFTNKFGSKYIIMGSGFLIFLGLLTAVIFPYLLTGILGFLLVGAGTSSVIPLTYNEVGKNKNFQTGFALAMVSTIGYFGFLLGPPLIGFIADLVSLRVSFTLIAVVGMMISLIVIMDKHTLKADHV